MLYFVPRIEYGLVYWVMRVDPAMGDATVAYVYAFPSGRTFVRSLVPLADEEIAQVRKFLTELSR